MPAHRKSGPIDAFRADGASVERPTPPPPPIQGRDSRPNYCLFTQPHRQEEGFSARHYIDVLDKRLQENGHTLLLHFDLLQFESAEKVYTQELAKTRKIVDRQCIQRSRVVTKLNNELTLEHAQSEHEWHPRNPQNKYANGRLTPHGVEVSYRLYDSHKSPMAVALLMRIPLRAAKRRKKQWNLAGGHQRKITKR